MLYGIQGIQRVEPHCQGVQAIWSPHTGIVNWEQVARQYGKVFKERGGHIKLNYEVGDFKPSSSPERPIEVVDKTSGQSITASYVLTCAGLQSDRVATMSGCASDPKIVPFRGEYLLLSPEKAKLIKGNIYPVPDPRFPFLGVHFTPRMNGEVNSTRRITWLVNAIISLSLFFYTRCGWVQMLSQPSKERDTNGQTSVWGTWPKSSLIPVFSY